MAIFSLQIAGTNIFMSIHEVIANAKFMAGE